MRPSVHEHLQYILDEAEYLQSIVQDTNEQEFLRNETLKRAFVRSVEIIGEAVKQIPEDMRAQRPEIEWRSIAGMRDRLIHNYYGIDYEIVWDVVKNKIPELSTAVQAFGREKSK